MDQGLIAMLAVCAFALFGAGYFIGLQERKSRRSPSAFVHSGPDDVEKRARRAF